MAPRLVEPGEQPADQFSHEVQATLTKILASGAKAVCIIYETPEKIAWISVPDLQCIEIGLINIAAETINES